MVSCPPSCCSACCGRPCSHLFCSHAVVSTTFSHWHASVPLWKEALPHFFTPCSALSLISGCLTRRHPVFGFLTVFLWQFCVRAVLPAQPLCVFWRDVHTWPRASTSDCLPPTQCVSSTGTRHHESDGFLPFLLPGFLFPWPCRSARA